jgi:hypothetical protein
MDPRRPGFVRMATLVGNGSWLAVVAAFLLVRAGVVPPEAHAGLAVAMLVVVGLCNVPSAMVAASRAARRVPGALAVGLSVAIRLAAAGWIAAQLLAAR